MGNCDCPFLYRELYILVPKNLDDSRLGAVDFAVLVIAAVAGVGLLDMEIAIGCRARGIEYRVRRGSGQKSWELAEKMCMLCGNTWDG